MGGGIIHRTLKNGDASLRPLCGGATAGDIKYNVLIYKIRYSDDSEVKNKKPLKAAIKAVRVK